MIKVKVKVGKSLHRLNFPVLTSSFRPLFDLPDAPSAVPPTSSDGEQQWEDGNNRELPVAVAAAPAGSPALRATCHFGDTTDMNLAELAPKVSANCKSLCAPVSLRLLACQLW